MILNSHISVRHSASSFTCTFSFNPTILWSGYCYDPSFHKWENRCEEGSATCLRSHGVVGGRAGSGMCTPRAWLLSSSHYCCVEKALLLRSPRVREVSSQGLHHCQRGQEQANGRENKTKLYSFLARFHWKRESHKSALRHLILCTWPTVWLVKC